MIDGDFKVPEELENELWEIKEEQQKIKTKMEAHLRRFKDINEQLPEFKAIGDTAFLRLQMNLAGDDYNEDRGKNKILQLKKQRCKTKLKRVVPLDIYYDLTDDLLLDNWSNAYPHFTLPYVNQVYVCPKTGKSMPKSDDETAKKPTEPEPTPPVKHEKPPVKSLFSKIVGIFS